MSIEIIQQMLHKLAGQGLDNFKNKVKQYSQAPAFRPIPLETLLRPHPLWYLRKYKYHLLEQGVYYATAVVVIYFTIRIL